MANFHLEDRVAENSSTTGTSNFDLDGEVSGCQSFDAAYADGDTFIYVASLGVEWEIASGSFDATNNRVVRGAVRASSNAGAQVSFSAGVKEIAVVDDARALNLLYQLGDRVARSSNTALSIYERGKLIEFSSTFTQTFGAANVLGAAWFTYLYNGGTGDITLDPNSSETIDGLTSFIMYPGELRRVTCDGSNFFSTVLKGFYRSWTATAAGGFTKPPGYSWFEGLLWAGGAAGSRHSTAGTGGGGGACVPFRIASSALSATEDVTIGAAVAGRGTDGNGSDGNNSTFDLITAYGGGGGIANSNAGGGGGTLSAPTVGGQGGDPQGGVTTGNPIDSNFGGGAGRSTANGGKSHYGGGGGGGPNTGSSGIGGNSFYGGAGGGGVNSGGGGAKVGGTSVFGGNGGDASAAGTAVTGSAPGGGGGGTNTGTSGGGARGELRLWGVA